MRNYKYIVRAHLAAVILYAIWQYHFLVQGVHSGFIFWFLYAFALVGVLMTMVLPIIDMVMLASPRAALHSKWLAFYDLCISLLGLVVMLPAVQ